MNAVGIDVFKGKSMVCILKPYGEIISSPFENKHTSSDILDLIDLIKSVDGESRVVMEHTGRYYESLAHQLSQAGIFVSAINPKLIKDFDDDSLRKVKSDKADSVKIARYALDKWQNLEQYSVMDEIRNQLKTMNRQFGFYMKHKTAMKNNLIGILDQTYPGVNTYSIAHINIPHYRVPCSYARQTPFRASTMGRVGLVPQKNHRQTILPVNIFELISEPAFPSFSPTEHWHIGRILCFFPVFAHRAFEY